MKATVTVSTINDKGDKLNYTVVANNAMDFIRAYIDKPCVAISTDCAPNGELHIFIAVNAD